MSKTKVLITTSIDGYVAGPNQTEDDPIGEGGMALHEWMFKLETWRKAHGEEGGEVNPSTEIVAELESGFGAVIMGRNMFGPIRGDWGDESWEGWWGDDPPYHVPVYVLTHQDRDPVEKEGGTTFHFVTDGIESAHEQAREAAGEKDIQIAGGAQTVQQYLAAGLVDEITLNVVPLILGGGERLLDNIGTDTKLEQVRAVEAPGVAHLKYRVVK